MKGVPPELWLLQMNKMSLILRIQELKRSTFSILLRKKLGYVFLGNIQNECMQNNIFKFTFLKINLMRDFFYSLIRNLVLMC